MSKQTKDYRKKLKQVKKQVTGIGELGLDSLTKIGKRSLSSIGKGTDATLNLSDKQKKIRLRVKQKIACLTNKEKLKAMTPAGVDKLLKEATAEIEEEEGE